MKPTILLGILAALALPSAQTRKDPAAQKTSVAKSAADKSAAPAPARTKTTEDAVLVGAGDVAACADLSGAEATAKLLDKIPGTVFVVGDLAYGDGTDAEFTNCYGSTWGRHKQRTKPAPGNHEYHTPGAAGYFHYFGAVAGDPTQGWYSFDLGAWHIVSINSNCADVGGCQAGSAQEQWLRKDLAAHPGVCTLAFWHHPLVSSGPKPVHAMHPEMKAIWQALYEAHAPLVINGHEHNYERFAPMNSDGAADPSRGIREIVVGTGGRNHTPLGIPVPNSEVRNIDTFGVLKLTLHARSYDWEFIPESGKTFTDSGSGICK
jgi:hypothetical protein